MRVIYRGLHSDVRVSSRHSDPASIKIPGRVAAEFKLKLTRNYLLIRKEEDDFSKRKIKQKRGERQRQTIQSRQFLGVPRENQKKKWYIVK